APVLPIPGRSLRGLLRSRGGNPDASRLGTHGRDEHPPHEWPEELGRAVLQCRRRDDLLIQRTGQLARRGKYGRWSDQRRISRLKVRPAGQSADSATRGGPDRTRKRRVAAGPPLTTGERA